MDAVPATGAAIAADKSPSPIRRMRAPVERMLAINCSCRADRDHDDELVNLTAEAASNRIEVVAHRRIEVDQAPALGPTTSLSM